MRKISLIATLAAAAIAAPALPQTPSAQLDDVLKDHWSSYLSTHPTEATARGVRTYDDRIYDLSLAARAAEVKAEQGFVARLEAIPEISLDNAARVNRAVLLWTLRDDIASEAHMAKP